MDDTSKSFCQLIHKSDNFKMTKYKRIKNKETLSFAF